MKNSETKPAMIIEGVVLTEDAINTLKGFQNANNDFLECNLEVLADAICYINDTMDDTQKVEFKNAIEISRALSALRGYLKKIKKP